MPIKILTVDDSKTIRMVIQRTLGEFDCAFCEAANGEEGLAVALCEKPDLILLDISMPIMDGVSLLAALRQDPHLRVIPVIMLSAELKGENAARLSRLGVSDYLVKPFKEQLLLDKVRRIIPLSAKPARVECLGQD
jgi:two-component system cell cycle response regulator